MSQSLQQLVGSIYDLPPMPAVAAKVLEVLEGDDYTAESLADILARDAVLAGRLLHMANSAFYGVTREVETLARAVVILGEEALRNLVLAAGLKSFYQKPGMMQKRLWEDSVGCAIGSQLVARRFHSVGPDEAFLAGLFRHVGKMIMMNIHPAQYQDLVDEMAEGKEPGPVLEKKYFQFTHAVIGAAVLEKWNFRKKLVQSTRHHDRLDLSAELHPAAYRLCATVNIATHLCRALGIGCTEPDAALQLARVPGALALGIGYAQMKVLLVDLESTFNENIGFFSD